MEFVQRVKAKSPHELHRNSTYHSFAAVFQNCSIWMPLDPVTKENTLFFVKGSHRWGWYYPRKFATESKYQTIHDDVTDKDYENLPDIDGNKEKYDIVSWAMEVSIAMVTALFSNFQDIG
jgi:ectoine hydroxylase-related dioxygenase (phytanoyl-CoA dioxygenase family)